LTETREVTIYNNVKPYKTEWEKGKKKPSFNQGILVRGVLIKGFLAKLAEGGDE